MNKEVRDLIKRVEAQGFEVARTTKGHYMVRKGGERVTLISGTPSNHHSLKNAKAQLKRAGYID
ncbi:hypothetical protein OG875_05040 [Streptomyces sp. NBC_01498]|uniref:hypothetical protein n=1 Tax=Streptomyces sp. NBC_01498 TaxID=2975870 RepID=UPI002E7C4456|nr:hypothetical protein [Streptomyces sp. NBC_01498]WTL24023.1 hypothetical protein OG875_05040 [Streptomyces sp. NBC_01498]